MLIPPNTSALSNSTISGWGVTERQEWAAWHWKNGWDENCEQEIVPFSSNLSILLHKTLESSRVWFNQQPSPTVISLVTLSCVLFALLTLLFTSRYRVLLRYSPLNAPASTNIPWLFPLKYLITSSAWPIWPVWILLWSLKEEFCRAGGTSLFWMYFINPGLSSLILLRSSLMSSRFDISDVKYSELRSWNSLEFPHTNIITEVIITVNTITFFVLFLDQRYRRILVWCLRVSTTKLSPVLWAQTRQGNQVAVCAQCTGPSWAVQCWVIFPRQVCVRTIMMMVNYDWDHELL